MTILVYSISGAPRCWRVLTALTLKNLPFEIRYLEGSQREHKADDYLKINPRGKVPAVVADDFVVRDSTAILAWLERAYPATPLFGTTPEETATIWQVCMEIREYLRSTAQRLLFPLLVRNLPLDEIEAGQLQDMQEASSEMQRELALLEERVVSRTFLCGTDATAAEAFAYPELRLLNRALERKPKEMQALGIEQSADRYPALFEWMGRVKSLPGMDKTEPRHWT